MALSGSYYVKPTSMAMKRAWKLCQGRAGGVAIIRSHALKLRFWPDAERDEADLNWDWIEGLQSKRIGELRIDETIAGNNNLRVIFFKANKMIAGDPLLRIWLLTVFQKKGQGFSAGEIASFRAMHGLLIQREYGGNQNA